jgi:hypothetical protein
LATSSRVTSLGAGNQRRPALRETPGLLHRAAGILVKERHLLQFLEKTETIELLAFLPIIAVVVWFSYRALRFRSRRGRRKDNPRRRAF